MSNRNASIAIAGGWGYIGRKLVDAALTDGLRVYVHDPGAFPADLPRDKVTHIADPSAFYALEADLFHLALHPEARQPGLDRLLERGAGEPVWVLNEKPMVAPESPAAARTLIEAVDRGQAVMLFDFPELFDPLTGRILEYLAPFRRVEFSSIAVERSKDREDPAIARNYKRMLPIQFQESAHCLAFVLFLLGREAGRRPWFAQANPRDSLPSSSPPRGILEVFDTLLAGGVSIRAEAEPYAPPNPEVYPCVVDGRCSYQVRIGPLSIEGATNFKRGAAWCKRRRLSGLADGQPFIIEVDYLEGRKSLRINGVNQDWPPDSSSYRAILGTLSRWRVAVPRERLLTGIYPNPRLAWLAYQLSGALWRSSHERRPLYLANLGALCACDSGYAAALPRLPRYGRLTVDP